MISLSQTYSNSVSITNIQTFLTNRGIADKVNVVCNDIQWYNFESNYFSEHQLHDILDDLCDYVLEAAEWK
jgi:hypothetical protein